MAIKEKCFICGDKNAELGFDMQSSYQYRVCPVCGKYILPESTIKMLLDESPHNKYYKLKLAQFLFYNKFAGYQFIGTDEEFIDYKIELPKLNLKEFELKLVTEDKVNNWFPKTFSERIDKILMQFYKKMNYIGENLEYTYLELLDIFLIDHRDTDINSIVNSSSVPVKYKDQIYYITDFLYKSKYMLTIVPSVPNGAKWHSKITVQFTPEGLVRIDDLQRKQANNKDVFVAMSFKDDNNYIFEAIKNGITDAGYSDKFMKKIIHNKQIVPYMLRLIKDCKFLVMDITDPNYGAYYEAGYALGLNKEVIITCKKDIFEKKEFNNPLEERALKPHFDIAQRQILVWEDASDLTKQLTQWIKFLIG